MKDLRQRTARSERNAVRLKEKTKQLEDVVKDQNIKMKEYKK